MVTKKFIGEDLGVFDRHQRTGLSFVSVPVAYHASVRAVLPVFTMLKIVDAEAAKAMGVQEASSCVLDVLAKLLNRKTKRTRIWA
jgi:hypothetical protein